MSNIDQKQIQFMPAPMQRLMGKKGPLCCRLNLNFAASPTFHLDMQQVQSTNNFDYCQAIFVDNSAGGDTVTISIPASSMKIVVKAGWQGWFNVVCPNPIVMDFASNGGTLATILLVNSAIPGSAWPTN